MRIAKKDIERLTYVENALSKRDDHLAKVVHNVLHELNPEFVYVVVEEGSWDYEFTNHSEVYASFGDAVNSFKNLARVARSDIKNWISEDQISESEQIDEEKQTASFEIYEDGDFTRLHNTITITKKEIIQRKERSKVNRITSPGMPGMNDTVLTYYDKYDIIYKNERGCQICLKR